ncbi:bifunctional P-loop containing nucleoside triphosphate hydrolase/ATP-dependent RNA helicase DEAD-box [Babesia duncani]|uniref:RNA helicase n=1 Tax=Babesia duncani TaxID=323732 RepID=A0AAD9PJT4_9APIC|nr:bifunctional P-loop containing nucleoside triphosphate hydrolase/ATP-dependent RNA helicase DEAD-box [Babesia duncani]
MKQPTTATNDSAAPPPERKIYIPPSRRNPPEKSTVDSTVESKGFSQPTRTMGGDEPRKYSGGQRRDRDWGSSFGDFRQRDSRSVPSLWATRGDRRYYKEDELKVFDSVKTRTQAGINFGSYDNIPVQLTGRQSTTLQPVEDFESGIHEMLMPNVRRVNYTKPTPIQKHSISVILAGRDLMACAQTGSGKTAAFLLPIVTRMLNTGPPDAVVPSGTYSMKFALPVCLVLSPTRELAVQTYTEARKFIFNTGVRCVCLYGGNEVYKQLIDLDRGCDICVATPGRLSDLIDRRKVGLHCVAYLVLDEADRMLDMGFAPQIRAIVDHSHMPKTSRQTVMFSATFPKEIQQLAKDFLNDYIYLAVGRVGSTNEFIRQRLVYADQDQKPKYLIKLLRESGQGLVLIFVETKRRADMIEGMLLREDFRAVNIHGDRSQQDREEALRLFKSGERPILVATDVAARGLDINNITHVINCDLPTNIDDYVHRIGRTGRAGNVGIATSLVNEANRPILKDLLALLQESNQEVPSWFQKLVSSMAFSSGTQYSRRGGGQGGKYSRSFGSRDVRGNTETATYNHGNRFKSHGNQPAAPKSNFTEFEDDWW